MKGISPLIATVLLIGFTVAIAGILATWGSTYTTGKLTTIETSTAAETACSGGNIKFHSGYPKLQNNTIVAIVDVGSVPLGNYTFVVITTNDRTLYLKEASGAVIPVGFPGTLISETTTLTKSDIKSVQIHTNCIDVQTLASPVY